MNNMQRPVRVALFVFTGIAFAILALKTTRNNGVPHSRSEIALLSERIIAQMPPTLSRAGDSVVFARKAASMSRITLQSLAKDAPTIIVSNKHAILAPLFTKNDSAVLYAVYNGYDSEIVVTKLERGNESRTIRMIPGLIVPWKLIKNETILLFWHLGVEKAGLAANAKLERLDLTTGNISVPATNVGSLVDVSEDESKQIVMLRQHRFALVNAETGPIMEFDGRQPVFVAGDEAIVFVPTKRELVEIGIINLTDNTVVTNTVTTGQKSILRAWAGGPGVVFQVYSTTATNKADVILYSIRDQRTHKVLEGIVVP